MTKAHCIGIANFVLIRLSH